MTQFKSARELEPMLAEKPLSKWNELWEREAVLINELAMHEGQYAQYPRRFKTFNAASSFASSIVNGVRHSFQPEVCNLPGGFRTKITEDDGTYEVWIAYAGEGRSDA